MLTLGTLLRVWGSSDTLSYWKGSWASIDWKCPTFFGLDGWALIRVHSIGTYLFGTLELVFSIYPWFALRQSIMVSDMATSYCPPALSCSTILGAFSKLLHLWHDPEITLDAAKDGYSPSSQRVRIYIRKMTCQKPLYSTLNAGNKENVANNILGDMGKWL